MEGLDHRSNWNGQGLGDRIDFEWSAAPSNWCEPCPHFLAHDKKLLGPQVRRKWPIEIKPCHMGAACRNLTKIDSWAGQIWSASAMGGTKPPAARCFETAGAFRIPRPAYWVCRAHLEHTRMRYQHKAFLREIRVGTCKYHMNLYRARYPRGLNTCTCEKILSRWLCREDYKEIRAYVASMLLYRQGRPQTGKS